MGDKKKAIDLLSRAEISLMAAAESLREHHLEELDGEITAVEKIIDNIREESSHSL